MGTEHKGHITLCEREQMVCVLKSSKSTLSLPRSDFTPCLLQTACRAEGLDGPVEFAIGISPKKLSTWRGKGYC